MGPLTGFGVKEPFEPPRVLPRLWIPYFMQYVTSIGYFCGIGTLPTTETVWADSAHHDRTFSDILTQASATYEYAGHEVKELVLGYNVLVAGGRYSGGVYMPQHAINGVPETATMRYSLIDKNGAILTSMTMIYDSKWNFKGSDGHGDDTLTETTTYSYDGKPIPAFCGIKAETLAQACNYPLYGTQFPISIYIYCAHMLEVDYQR